MKKVNVKDRKLKKFLAQTDHTMVIADGLSDAFIGLVVTADGLVCAYDKNRVINLLMKKNKWSHDEAIEYADFNIFSAYVFRGPIFLEPVSNTEWDYVKE